MDWFHCGLQLLCCLPVLLWKFLKENLYPDIDDYYRRNPPTSDEADMFAPGPEHAEAPAAVSALVVTSMSVPEGPTAPTAVRNQKPSALEHVKSRSDFTPGPSRHESR